MSYNISIIQDPRSDKNNLQRVRIQLIYLRTKVYISTSIKVSADQFKNGKILNHPKATKINSLLNSIVSQVEDRLLDEIRTSKNITKDRLKEIANGKVADTSTRLVPYAKDLQVSLQGKLSVGRLRIYTAIVSKIEAMDAGVTFFEVSTPWLNKLEMFIRQTGVLNNTLTSNMAVVKAILNRALVDGLIKEEQFKHYKAPGYKETLPIFLEETEIEKILPFVESLGPGHLKLSGYYFLLSCYAGYRISDVRKFRYSDHVNGKQIVLRAAKNGKIVSIPIHSRLQKILSYIKDKPIEITEEHIRKHVKTICRMVGIKKEVKFHTGRHSFAMLLMKSGFTIDDVSHLLGDTSAVAKVYAKVHNPTLNAKVMDLLG